MMSPHSNLTALCLVVSMNPCDSNKGWVTDKYNYVLPTVVGESEKRTSTTVCRNIDTYVRGDDT